MLKRVWHPFFTDNVVNLHDPKTPWGASVMAFRETSSLEDPTKCRDSDTLSPEANIRLVVSVVYFAIELDQNQLHLRVRPDAVFGGIGLRENGVVIVFEFAVVVLYAFDELRGGSAVNPRGHFRVTIAVLFGASGLESFSYDCVRIYALRVAAH